MTNVKDRYEFIEEMFEKLGRISVDCRTVYETDSERKTLDGAMSFSSRYKTRVLYCNTG